MSLNRESNGRAADGGVTVSDGPIRWPAGLDRSELEYEIGRGGRFVFFEFCVSVLIASRRGTTDVIFLRAEESSLWRGLPWALLTLFCGWWAVPWGLVWTPLALYTYFLGGRDVTAEVLALGPPGPPAEEPP
jgi:hypothetical protein